MLKKLYFKQIVFFLFVVAQCRYNYCMDIEEEVQENAFRRAFKRAMYDDDRNNNRFVKAQTPMLEVIQRSVKQGAADALTKSALNVISTVLQIVPYSVSKIIAMIKIYAYKLSFGTSGLTVRDLTKFSNRVQTLCSSLASTQTGNLRRTRRAGSIENEQDNGESVDAAWLKQRLLLVSELEHVVGFLRSVLPCYNAAFQSIDASLVERRMASILYALSTENNNEIQNYIIRLIGYLKDLIDLLESFNSFDNAIEHADETKRMLTIVRTTFEHVSTFLADANAKGAGSFQNMTDKLGNNKRADLMDLLGSGGLK